MPSRCPSGARSKAPTTAIRFQWQYSQDYTNAGQAPDGLPNYIMRAQQNTSSGYTYASTGTPVAGLNTANAVNSSTTTAILPGFTNVTPNSDFPVDLATNVNFTIEQPLKWNSALRVSYVWSHGTNLDQDYYYNNHASSFVWEMQHGVTTPNGGASVIGTSAANTYAATATGPYDQTTWGNGGYIVEKSGWSNNNELQANYQKLYHSGVAWQISYVWQKTLRVGGDWTRDNEIMPAADYANSGLATYSAVDAVSAMPITPALPPPTPSNLPSYAYFRALNAFENYGAIDNSGAPRTAGQVQLRLRSALRPRQEVIQQRKQASRRAHRRVSACRRRAVSRTSISPSRQPTGDRPARSTCTGMHTPSPTAAAAHA